jgi:hypothetical protein
MGRPCLFEVKTRQIWTMDHPQKWRITPFHRPYTHVWSLSLKYFEYKLYTVAPIENNMIALWRLGSLDYFKTNAVHYFTIHPYSIYPNFWKKHNLLFMARQGCNLKYIAREFFLGFWNSFSYKIVLKTCKIPWGNPYSRATVKSTNFPTDHQSFSRAFYFSTVISVLYCPSAAAIFHFAVSS